MKNEENITSYSASELRAMKAQGRSDLARIDALSDEDLERLLATDEDEAALRPDWMRAVRVTPRAKRSVHLRLDQDTVDFYKSRGKGHISLMQAVLKAYAEAHGR